MDKTTKLMLIISSALLILLLLIMFLAPVPSKPLRQARISKHTKYTTNELNEVQPKRRMTVGEYLEKNMWKLERRKP